MRTLSPLLFAGTIFSSAFLLFLVQPIIAKQILPWFGGSAAVWTVCMVFFQVVLLAGYAYSDLVTRRLSPRGQQIVHGALLVASLLCLPIVTNASWKPVGDEAPTARILGLLTMTIGLPYFLLSTTGPLVQGWVARAPWGGSVYRLFALSNFASLAALVAYPLTIEPWVALRAQAVGWSVGYGVFVLLCAGSAWVAAQLPPLASSRTPSESAAERAPPRTTQALWLAFPALSSWLLLAVTNHITQHVASIPFLWILPLATYLLTFILCFESDRWYRRGLFLPLAAIALVLASFGLTDSIGTRVKSAVPLYVGSLFILCMVLHGEMARLRPGRALLTRYYLMLSLGGAAGGIVVGLVAPLVLVAYYELGIGFLLTALLGIPVLWPRRAAAVAAAVVGLATAWFLSEEVRDDRKNARLIDRNFYGTLLTHDTDLETPHDACRVLRHGSVIHGEQYLDPSRRREATSYYGLTSGIGRVLSGLPDRPARVGLVGLGAGTLVTYARAGDTYRLYEINPQVFDFARREFSFLSDARGTLEPVLGDARLALEREPPQAYDVLAIDAFSGGSVPVHLITMEAMDIYLRHLAPGGVLAFHVTNRFIDLPPVLQEIARAKGLSALLVHDEAETSDLRRTDWMLISREPGRLEQPSLKESAKLPSTIPGLRPWTDDFNDLLSVLK